MKLRASFAHKLEDFPEKNYKFFKGEDKNVK
jgi:hypothetical protein